MPDANGLEIRSASLEVCADASELAAVDDEART